MLRGAAAVLLACVACGAAGCGGGRDARDEARAGVERYVRDENALLRRAGDELRRLNDAYVGFARAGRSPSRRTRVTIAGGEGTVVALRDEIARLRPPPAGRRLHASVLRYLDLNATLARETARLAAYEPAARHVLAPLDRLRARIRRALTKAAIPEEQARALRRFAAALGRMLGRLRSLTPPAVLMPAQRDQIRRLRATREVAVRLASSLQARDTERVARLVIRFSLTGAPRRPRRLDAAALRRYARRLTRLRDAYTAVQREQVRLSRPLQPTP